MKTIQKGTLCIWQNVAGPVGQKLNGNEVTAMSGLMMVPCSCKSGSHIGYETDEIKHDLEGLLFGITYFAGAGQLRPKDDSGNDEEETNDVVLHKPIVEVIA